MEFLNDQVPVEQLPRQEQVLLTPIEPAYLTVLRWEWRIASLVLAIAVGALLYFAKPFQTTLWRSLLPAAWLVVVAAWYWLQGKSFASRAYAIREKDVIYRKGWIIQSTRTCPFNRIQHIALSMGPLERRFGLAGLVLYTAGSNDADMHIPGLPEALALDLKEWITKKIADEPSEPVTGA
jgi:membrane protein YdbS with pleckstrin-like domain